MDVCVGPFVVLGFCQGVNFCLVGAPVIEQGEVDLKGMLMVLAGVNVSSSPHKSGRKIPSHRPLDRFPKTVTMLRRVCVWSGGSGGWRSVKIAYPLSRQGANGELVMEEED